MMPSTMTGKSRLLINYKYSKTRLLLLPLLIIMRHFFTLFVPNSITKVTITTLRTLRQQPTSEPHRHILVCRIKRERRPARPSTERTLKRRHRRWCPPLLWWTRGYRRTLDDAPLKGRSWVHIDATQGGLRTPYVLADPPRA